MPINIKEFNDRKLKGVARILESNVDKIIVAYKSFDLEKAKLGELVELEEQVASESRNDLIARKAALQSEIKEIDIFLNL